MLPLASFRSRIFAFASKFARLIFLQTGNILDYSNLTPLATHVPRTRESPTLETGRNLASEYSLPR